MTPTVGNKKLQLDEQMLNNTQTNKNVALKYKLHLAGLILFFLFLSTGVNVTCDCDCFQLTTDYKMELK